MYCTVILNSDTSGGGPHPLKSLISDANRSWEPLKILSRFEPRRLSLSFSRLVSASSATGHTASADINTGHNEIFKIKEKNSPIKASIYCDPEDAGGLVWGLGNPLPAPLMPINLDFMQPVETIREAVLSNILRFSNISVSFGLCGCLALELIVCPPPKAVLLLLKEN